MLSYVRVQRLVCGSCGRGQAVRTRLPMDDSQVLSVTSCSDCQGTDWQAWPTLVPDPWVKAHELVRRYNAAHPHALLGPAAQWAIDSGAVYASPANGSSGPVQVAGPFTLNVPEGMAGQVIKDIQEAIAAVVAKYQSPVPPDSVPFPLGPGLPMPFDWDSDD